MPDQPITLEVIATNTIAVLTSATQHRDEWLDNVRQIHTEAVISANALMAELLDAVIRLLVGVKPHSINPQLSGQYENCWVYIVHGLAEWELRPLLEELQGPARLSDMPHRIGICHEALNLVSQDEFPETWAALQVRLGNSLIQNPLGDRAENVEQAITCYQQALEVYSCKDLPADWAMTQNNLGNAYDFRVQGARMANIEQAITHYRQALEIYTPETFPEQWATTQDNLATAFSNRIQGNRADNIEQAICHYRQALKVRSYEVTPADWAMTQNNLATAYLDRLQGERAENIEQAITYYQQALEVRTREAFPEQWATIQNNLANAYSRRLGGERAENMEQAIYHYQQALEVYQREAFPEQWATTQNNLATGYRNRILGEQTQNIEQAITHYQQALEVRMREALPEQWATTQNNLANAYSRRLWGERAENIEQAIDHYQQALMVYTRWAFPEQWAATHNNLGEAYCSRVLGVRTKNVEQAIIHYQLALEVNTHEAFPAAHCRTQRNLGNLYFGEEHWNEALNAYRAAIIAVNDLMAAAYSEVGRHAEIGETAQIYAHAAYCLLQIGQPGEALAQLEAGKTRLLGEALALADADLSGLPDEQRQQMISRRHAVRELEAEMRLPLDTPARRSDRNLADLLRKARVHLNTLIADIRKDNSNFMPMGLNLSEMMALIPESGALVVPLITSQGSAIFVVPHGITEVTAQHIIWLNKLKDSDLHALLVGTQEDPGWLWAYRIFRDNPGVRAANEAWKASIDRMGNQLWERVIAPVYTRLKDFGIRHVQLMSSGGLQLLPLHSAWRIVNGEKRTILDDFEDIRYTPSAYVLQICQQRAQQREGKEALVAGINLYNTLPRLVNACLEAEAIAVTLCTYPLLDAEATKEAIYQGCSGKSYIHLSCHGSFVWASPLASALYLANDQPLALSEIIGRYDEETHSLIRMDLDAARLVTLSACETGITDISQSPEEYVGLPAGFLQAGASAVVSSLWTVDDRSTALLMEQFYRNHLERGMPPARALREAQLWLRDATRRQLGEYYQSHLRMASQQADEGYTKMMSEGDPAEKVYAHPLYWAPFTFTGA